MTLLESEVFLSGLFLADFLAQTKTSGGTCGYDLF